MSKAGPSLLRATLFRAADTARRQDPQLARIYYQQMTERGANHLKASCVVAGHLAERAWTVLQPRHALRDLRQQREPRHRGAGPADHRREVDRPGGGPQAPPQPQDGGEGPSGGRNRAAPARRPSPPPIVAAPPPASQARHLTQQACCQAGPAGFPGPPAAAITCPARARRPPRGHPGMPACRRQQRITIMPETGITLDPDQADDLRDLITLTAILRRMARGRRRPHPRRPGPLRLPRHLPPAQLRDVAHRRPRRHLPPAPHGPLTPATSQNRPEPRSATSTAGATASTTARSEDLLQRWP